MKPTVLIDQDQVLVFTVPAILKRIHELTKKRILQKDILKYNFFGDFGIEKSTIKEIFTSDFFRDLVPIEEASLATERLANYFDLHLATSGPDCEGKKVSLKTHFPHIEKMHITEDKHLLEGDILIDDCTENLKKFLATGRPVICFDYNGQYNYNKDFKEDNIMSFRATTWQEVEEILYKYFGIFEENKKISS